MKKNIVKNGARKRRRDENRGEAVEVKEREKGRARVT